MALFLHTDAGSQHEQKTKLAAVGGTIHREDLL